MSCVSGGGEAGLSETGLHFRIKQRLVTDKIIRLTKLACWKNIEPLVEVRQGSVL